ncbi:MAG: hypothetical protein L0H79_15080 [Intrasporangium sp.]|uniref:hypothetical protein n=1 Tax=Intrasporangium sp. TaxID=1925024 RepID=UPI002648165F|nr:hypothetical protein [Intrasporangium sp.]MDN5797064.1 hypothetical protein [Intrasporangium sp.]
MRSLVENPPDGHDLDCLIRAVEAGGRGDAEGSLACELAGSVILESPHRFVLKDLVDHGERAPAWAYSRWCADLAYRSMLLAEDPRTDAAVRYVLAALYPGSLARVLDDKVEFLVLGTGVAAGDHLVADLALYEFGGLADYISERAEAGLLDRTDRIRDWVNAQMRAYEFVGVRGCRLVLHDLVDGGEVEVLNIGAMSQASDEALVGRLVPITCEPGLMFAARPISVDPGTARTVAEAVRTSEPLAWLEALSTALVAGRQAEGFHRTAATPFTSDLPMPAVVVDEAAPAEEAGRIIDLRAKGYSAEVANAVTVLEVGLIAAEISDRAAAAASPHIAAAMGTAGAFEAAAMECTGTDTAAAWRVLAAVVPDHIAERCRILARHADSAGGSPRRARRTG